MKGLVVRSPRHGSPFKCTSLVDKAGRPFMGTLIRCIYVSHANVRFCILPSDAWPSDMIPIICLPMQQIRPHHARRWLVSCLSLPREPKDPASFASMDELREHLNRQGAKEGSGKPSIGLVAFIDFLSQVSF